MKLHELLKGKQFPIYIRRKNRAGAPRKIDGECLKRITIDDLEAEWEECKPTPPKPKAFQAIVIEWPDGTVSMKEKATIIDEKFFKVGDKVLGQSGTGVICYAKKYIPITTLGETKYILEDAPSRKHQELEAVVINHLEAVGAISPPVYRAPRLTVEKKAGDPL